VAWAEDASMGAVLAGVQRGWCRWWWWRRGRTAGESGGQLASRAVRIQAHKNRRATEAWDGLGNEWWYVWCGRLMGGEDWERERERAAASAYHDSACVRPPPPQQRAVRLCPASGRRARATTLAARLPEQLSCRLLCSSLASWHYQIVPLFDSAGGREACVPVRGGRLTRFRQRQ